MCLKHISFHQKNRLALIVNHNQYLALNTSAYLHVLTFVVYIISGEKLFVPQHLLGIDQIFAFSLLHLSSNDSDNLC